MHSAIRAVAVFLISSVAVPVGTLLTVLAAFLFLPLPATLPKAKPGVASSISHVYDINGNEIAIFREFETDIPVQRKDIPPVLTPNELALLGPSDVADLKRSTNGSSNGRSRARSTANGRSTSNGAAKKTTARRTTKRSG